VETNAKVTRRTEALGKAPLGPLLVRLSIPGAVGMLVMSLYNIVDTFWVSGLPNGPKAIAALTVTFPLQMIAVALGVGTGIGTASLVSRRFGENRVDEVNDVGGHAVVMPLVAGGALLGLCLLIPGPMLQVFGAKPDTLNIALTYLVVIGFGFPFQLFAMTVNGLYRGAGNAVMPMVCMAVPALVNILLDPFLIYGWGPFPRLEVQGAALATTIAKVVGFAISATYLWSGHSGYHIRLRHFRPRLSILRDIAQVGGPACAMHFVQSAVVSVFNRVLGVYGSNAIAAYGLTFRVLMLVVPCLRGLSQGLMPIVGYNFGAGQFRRMWRAIRTAALWSVSMSLGLGIVLWAFTPQVVAVFARTVELQDLTVLSLRLVLLGLWLAAPQMIAVTALQGMGFGHQAMALALTRQLFFLIPGLLILSSLFGVAGAFASQPVADVLSLLVTGAYFRTVYRRYRASLADPVDSAQQPEPETADVADNT